MLALLASFEPEWYNAVIMAFQLFEFLTLKFVGRKIPSGTICILVPKLTHHAYIRTGVLTTFIEINPL